MVAVMRRAACDAARGQPGYSCRSGQMYMFCWARRELRHRLRHDSKGAREARPSKERCSEASDLAGSVHSIQNSLAFEGLIDAERFYLLKR